MVGELDRDTWRFRGHTARHPPPRAPLIPAIISRDAQNMRLAVPVLTPLVPSATR